MTVVTVVAETTMQPLSESCRTTFSVPFVRGLDLLK